jgi:CBS domain-containing protein
MKEHSMQVKAVMRTGMVTVEADAALGQVGELVGVDGATDIPVVRRQRLVGVLGERERRRAAPSGVAALARYESPALLDRVRVAEVMAAPPVGLAPEAPLADAARLMAAQGRRSLPVLDGEVVVGLVTVGAVLDALLHRLETRAPSRLGRIVIPLVDAVARAVGVGLDLARRQGAEAVLLSIVPRRSAAAEPPAKGRLRGSLAIEVVEGPLGAAIVRAAGRLGADLIVLGVGSRSGRRLVAAVAEAAPCPVLAVPAIREGDRARR